MSRGGGGAVEIGGVHVGPGETRSIDLPVAGLTTGAELTMPVRVLRGRKPGPVLFVSAAIHGDEICGVEIIRRLLRQKALARLRGTLIAVPVVNVFGFLHHSRYLPDRRDLNRVFPGSEKGSLAARLAHLFIEEVVSKSTHGIDLHTAARDRANLPQIRVDGTNAEARTLARAFGAPIVIDSRVRDGSLREVVAERGIPVLVYEGGEALRFDEWAIRAGLRGVVQILQHLEMLPRQRRKRPLPDPMFAQSSSWVRAPESGLFLCRNRLGTIVEEGQRIGTITDPAGIADDPVIATATGLIIGVNRLPVVNEGDALVHIARFDDGERVAETIEAYQESYIASPTGPTDGAAFSTEPM